MSVLRPVARVLCGVINVPSSRIRVIEAVEVRGLVAVPVQKEHARLPGS
jgi:hypothetical protein